MSKFLKLLGIAAVLGLSAPAKASAVEVFNWSGCGGQNFASCATVIANWDAGTLRLTFSVENTNPIPGWQGSISAVGFDGLGSYSEAAPLSGWDLQDGPPGPGNPIGLGFSGFLAPGHPDGGLHSGESQSFVMQFGAAPSFANFTFGLREIGLEGSDWGGLNCETSNRLYVNKTGDTYTELIGREGDAECYNFPDDPPTEVVPEPATMVLLATGLIGLAGAQLRRRKNTKV